MAEYDILNCFMDVFKITLFLPFIKGVRKALATLADMILDACRTPWVGYTRFNKDIYKKNVKKYC